MLYIIIVTDGKKICLHSSLEVTLSEGCHCMLLNTIVYTTEVGWITFLAWCIDNDYGMSVCVHTNDYNTRTYIGCLPVALP